METNNFITDPMNVPKTLRNKTSTLITAKSRTITPNSEFSNKKVEDYFKPVPYLKPLAELPSKLSEINEDEKEYSGQNEIKGFFIVRKILNQSDYEKCIIDKSLNRNSRQNFSIKNAERNSFDKMVNEMTRKSYE